ncbi:hypothetical protein ACFFJB_14095 [Camelimonas abortus]|uniref:Uncharacterized protein n=1 Tax=Camelimonas abortus TaxID=1017184 RepID=A0ABV7LEA8_9HYPH
MRVNLSRVARAFGGGGRHLPARGECDDAAAFAAPAAPSGRDGASGSLVSAFLAPQDADAIPDLTPDLRAWLAAPAGAASGDDCGPFCATLPPADSARARRPPPEFDRDALMQAVTGRLRAPAPPAAAPAFRVELDIAQGEICGDDARGLHLRLDPSYASCEPVYVAIGHEAARDLARRILARVGDGAAPFRTLPDGGGDTDGRDR